MAAEESKPGKPQKDDSARRTSWRGSQTSGPSRGGQYRWQKFGDDVSREVARQNLRRRIKLTLLSCVAIGLCGVFAWYWLMRPRATPLLAIAITRYSAPLPPNGFAQEDQTRLADAARTASGGGGVLTVASSPAASTVGGSGGGESSSDVWNLKDGKHLLALVREWVEHARPGGPDRSLFGSGGTVVVYVSAHGVVDEKGRACLVPADAARSPGESTLPPHLDSAHWLPVTDIVRTLDETRPDVYKLIVLDCNRMDAVWSMGVLCNGFADALGEALGQAKSVAILNSAGSGEVAWSSVELQGTPFGFFATRALIGDPASDGNRDGRLSVSELATFVSQGVSNWVRDHRRDRQVPRLVRPADLDFDVVFADRGAVRDQDGVTVSIVRPVESEELAKKLEVIDGLWAQLDSLWQEEQALRTRAAEEPSPVWSEHCLAWHRFLQGLVRCEALILAGEAYRDRCEGVLRDLKEDAKALFSRRGETLPLRSLALARAWHKEAGTQASRRAEAAAYLNGEKKTIGEALASDYYSRADAAWNWLTSGQLLGAGARDAQRKALDFTKSPPPAKSDLVEIHLLRLLASDAPDTVWKQPEARLLSLINLREAAEQAAAPADVRALYALRQRIELADAELRRLENSLFLGDETSTQNAASLESAQGAYSALLADAQRLATLFTRRDLAWAELPYLAAWLARRENATGPDAEGLKSVSREIRRLRDFDVRLDGYLESFLSGAEQPNADDALEELNRLAASIDRSRQDWREKLRHAVQPGEAGDEVALRGITSLLASPLVAGDERRALRKPYLKAARNLAAGAAAGSVAQKPHLQQEDRRVLGSGVRVQEQNAQEMAGADGGSEAENFVGDGASGNRYAEELRRNHPALALVGLDEEPAGDAAAGEAAAGEQGGKQQAWQWLAAQGGRLRQRLAALTTSTATMPAPPTDEPRPARAAYSGAEREARSSAALCAPVRLAGPDANERLALFDLNEFLAWRAERELNDYWGSGEIDAAAKSYFALGWTEWHDAARPLRGADLALARDLQIPWTASKERYTRLVQETSRATFGAPWPEVSRSQGATFQRKVTPVVLSAPVPPGDAAMFVRDPGGKTHLSSFDGKTFFERVPAAVGEGVEAAQKSLIVRRGKPDESAAAASGRWSLTWLYRGHHHTKTFSLVDDEGLRLVYQRPEVPEHATITVLGNELSQASIVFILDCSASMNEQGGGGRTRMGHAQRALTDILDRLPIGKECRVGLWLYGHRLGWTRGQPPEARLKPGRAPPPGWQPGDNANNRLGPEDDVEEVVTLRPFNALAKQELTVELNGADPWGETPLYLSIIRAVTDTNWPALRATRHLVVITDGRDEQWAHRNNPGRLNAAAQKAIEADRQRHPQNRLRLHVLDCTAQIAPRQRAGVGPAAGANGNADLQKFTRDCQGSYYAVQNWNQLRDTLDKALGLAEYDVQPVELNVGQALGPTPLGETTTVPGPFDTPREYRVRIVGRRTQPRKVKLEGNEALRLLISRAGSADEQLIFERYTRGEDGIFDDPLRHRKITLPPGMTTGEGFPAIFDVLAHRPQPGQRTPDAEPWTFPISIQDGGEQPGFTPRPVEAWVELAPVTADGRRVSMAYPFYDMLLEPQTSVPVLLCNVPAWPPTARRAEVRVWFKLFYTAPSATPRISALPAADNPQAVDGVPGVSVGATAEDTEEGCRLTVTEQHPGEGECRWLRVQTTVPADSIVRTFSEGGRWAKHVFMFRGKSQVWLFDKPLWLTNQDAVKSQAIAVEEPLRLDVPTQGNLKR